MLDDEAVPILNRVVKVLFDSSLELVFDSSPPLVPLAKNDKGFFLGLLLLLLLESPLNLHELMVRPIFEEDYVPHQVDLLQAFVHDLHLLVKLGGHDSFFIT